MVRALTLIFIFALTTTVWAGEIQNTLVVLEVFSPHAPGQVGEAAPPRFALMEDGQVFVGGTSHVAVGHLEKKEMRTLEKRLSQIQHLPGLGSSVTLGPGGHRYHLLLRKGHPTEIIATGSTAEAPPSLKSLATFLDDLAAFDHPSLRRYSPTQFALSVREASVIGGCRLWNFPISLSDSLSGHRTIPAAAAEGWPTGATAASVCMGEKTYIVTLRPLLPGEKPE